MKALKFCLLFVVVTLVMAFSWAIGSLVGNLITDSAPPVVNQHTNVVPAAMAFLAVCAVNAALIVILVSTTRNYTGKAKQIALILFLFVVQTLLPQMETWFFASQINMQIKQVASIVISGAIVSTITMFVAILLHRKLIGSTTSQLLAIGGPGPKLFPMLALLIVVGYPFIYLSFGRMIAWQSETVRLYYTGLSEMVPFSQQLMEVFSTGLYFLQLFRASLWIAVTVPIVVMLNGRPVLQYLLVATLTSILPSSLLFIPNPYMPHEVAMVHFVETAVSNFIWGLVMVWAIKERVLILGASIISDFLSEMERLN